MHAIVSYALTGQALFEQCGRGQVDGALVVAVENGGVSSMTKQQRTNFYSVFRCSFMQRSELPQVHCIHAGAMLYIQEEHSIK